MKKYTVANIMALRPCYDRSKVEHLIGDGKTAAEIAELNVDVADKIWCLIGLLPEREQRLFACACAMDVLPIYEREYPNDLRVRNCIEAARNYANDPTPENNELMDAAQAAARAAAQAAAQTAAWNAAWNAALDAARAAAQTAAQTAACNAAWTAAWNAARDAQLQRLVEMHESLE
jgi:hypothetical protein